MNDSGKESLFVSSSKMIRRLYSDTMFTVRKTIELTRFVSQYDVVTKVFQLGENLCTDISRIIPVMCTIFVQYLLTFQ